MSTPTPTPQTPAELVKLWLPRLRKIAWRTGADLDDVRQEAWLLAASGDVRDADAADFVQRWLKAVAVQCSKQCVAGIITPKQHKKGEKPIGAGWLRASGREDGDAFDLLVAARRFAALDADGTIAAAVGRPETTAEIAAVTGKSERQARRIKKQIETLAEIQRDLFSTDETPAPEGVV